jgi:DeoR/GlpR family transcriptional regulator of sugar metabolism
MEVKFLNTSPITIQNDLNKIEIENKINEHKIFLASTDYKVLPFYELKEGENLNDIVNQRSIARKFIRENENALR